MQLDVLTKDSLTRRNGAVARACSTSGFPRDNGATTTLTKNNMLDTLQFPADGPWDVSAQLKWFAWESSSMHFLRVWNVVDPRELKYAHAMN